MIEPNWDKLRAVNAELRDHESKGTLSKAEYDRLLEEATAAVEGHEEFLEGILIEGMRLGYVNA